MSLEIGWRNNQDCEEKQDQCEAKLMRRVKWWLKSKKVNGVEEVIQYNHKESQRKFSSYKL